MRISLYCLTFPHGFHLAPHEHDLSLSETLPTIPADTLFSALVQAWACLGQDPAAWLDPFLHQNPPFLLTSAFPWAEDQPWFPKPLSFQPTREWKEVTFLPKALFFRIAKGELVAESPSSLRKQFWEIQEVPRVSLDRLTLRSNLFAIARVRFAKDCGLWFGVAWLDPDLPCGKHPFREAFQMALWELAETGLGGDRGVGYGRFHPEPVGDVAWPEPKPEGWGVLLSRLWPQESELELLRKSQVWRFTEVGGFARTAEGRHVRRLRVRLVVEGSVVPVGVRGTLVDLAPPGLTPHPIWRYGLALLYPWEVAYAHQN